MSVSLRAVRDRTGHSNRDASTGVAIAERGWPRLAGAPALRWGFGFHWCREAWSGREIKQVSCYSPALPFHERGLAYDIL
jgi:hypothetical protein